jgi:ethanolamine utilization protein EutN
MQLARVIGTVVATKKEEAMQGRKLLLLRPLLVDEANPPRLRDGAGTVVATDSLGAGPGETVLFCQGSSARQAAGLQTVPVDAVVVGIVDTVEVRHRQVYPAQP